MATARCYTKSGSVEKYESNLWKSPTGGNWSSTGIVGTITTPDSNGNYTVTPEQSFEDSSDTTTYSCFTEYGGVKKTFYFKKKEGTGYDLYCRVLYVNDNTDNSIGTYNPNYSNFSDKFGIDLIYIVHPITYGEIYKDHKDGYFCGTFYSNKEDTGSDTIEATVKLKSIIDGGQVNNGEVNFEFFLIPKGSNPANYKNEPSIDGEISPTSEVIDNRIYNKGNHWGISKGNYAMEHTHDDHLDQNYYEQCNLEIGVRCNFHFACRNLNRDDLNNWALGELSGIYTKVKNRYSTTIPYLKLNIIWDMNNHI